MFGFSFKLLPSVSYVIKSRKKKSDFSFKKTIFFVFVSNLMSKQKLQKQNGGRKRFRSLQRERERQPLSVWGWGVWWWVVT